MDAVTAGLLHDPEPEELSHDQKGADSRLSGLENALRVCRVGQICLVGAGVIYEDGYDK